MNKPDTATEVIRSCLAQLAEVGQNPWLQAQINSLTQSLNVIEFCVKESYFGRITRHDYKLHIDSETFQIYKLTHKVIGMIGLTIDVNTSFTHHVYDIGFIQQIEALEEVIAMHQIEIPILKDAIEATLKEA